MKTETWKQIPRLCAIAALMFAAHPRAEAQTEVSGNIFSQTWTLAGSPYIVVGNITAGGLTIQAGVQVIFQSNYVFEVDGKISAVGTAPAPIVFATTNGGWQGIFFNNASPGSVLDYCVISNSVNSGIRITNTSVTISNCLIASNTTAISGGGILVSNAADNLVLVNCTIINNIAVYGGGGVCAVTGTNMLTMSGCVVSNNFANPSSAVVTCEGGGVYVSGNSLLQNCVVCDNTCNGDSAEYQTQYGVGGGLYTRIGTAVIENCVFTANTAECGTYNGFDSQWPAWGGGIYLEDSGSLAMTNSIVSSNVTYSSQSEAGGGLYFYNGTTVTTCSVVNCTFAYNNTEGVQTYTETTVPEVMNSILFFNNNNGTQIAGTTNVTYCDVQGGLAGVGNINYDPVFESTTNLIIVPGSPCIDAGNPAAAYNDMCFPPSLGTALNDIGAHGGPGACDWSIPFPIPPNPLPTAVEGEIINATWTLANSPYRVVGNTFVADLTIQAGVQVIFQSNYVFEVDGKISAVGTAPAPIIFATTNGGWQGIFFNNASPGSVLDYCVISNSVNSGIRITNTSVTISNCLIASNTTAISGGGILVSNAADNLVLVNCTIINNIAVYGGGGVCAVTGTNMLTMSGCVVSNNFANPSSAVVTCEGGGVYVSGNSLLQNCVVCDNTCNGDSAEYQTQYGVGGGLYTRIGTAVIENCVFTANTAECGTYNGFDSQWPAWGGGIYLEDSGSLAMTNSIVSSNVTYSSQSEAGGGLYFYNGTTVTTCSVVNCTFAYNNTEGVQTYTETTVPEVMNSILFFNNNNGTQIAGTTNVTYCDVQGGLAGVGNINYDPVFESTTNLIIVPGSPCIDAGNPAAAYNDMCFPPSLGTALNDIGAHGGPGACDWSIPFPIPSNPLPTAVEGEIINATWTLANSPYHVVGNTFVADLTIQAGVQVIFQSNYVFEVDGKISAVGTAPAPIVFATTNGGWQGIFFNNASPGSVLDYCVISNSVNSGIRITNTSVTISNCLIASNTTAISGGGILVSNAADNLVLVNCTIINNIAVYGGGGVCAVTGTNMLTMSGCVVSNNFANPSSAVVTCEGGGVYVSGNSLLQNCVVSDNICNGDSAEYQTQYAAGGGLYSYTGTAVIVNCVFAANTAECGTYNGFDSSWAAYGGGIYIRAGSLAMTNSILSSNVTSSSDGEYGSGLCVNAAPSVTNSSVVNCTIAYNNTLGIFSQGTGEAVPLVMNSIVFFNNNNGTQIAGPTNVTYCDVQGGLVGAGNINFNPFFLSTTNFTIAPGSPCMDAGNPATAYDDACFPPSLGTATNDMGAYGGPGACGWFIVPEIAWTNPPAITYGTPLGSNEFNATASIPGSFNYTPPEGTVLNSGSNQTLSVLFTPTDAYINPYFNYTTAMVSVSLNVLPAPLTIEATNQSKTYGQTFTFSGTEFITGGLVNGDTVTNASLSSPGAPPTAPVSGSPYPIFITNAIGDAGLTNYTIIYVTGELTVNPAPLTITVGPLTKTFGQTVPSMYAAPPTVGLLNGDTVTSVTLNSPGLAGTASVAGSPYNVGLNAAAGSGLANYAIAYGNTTLSVSPAPLTVTASAETKAYGQTLPFSAGSTLFSSSGLQNGETIGTVTLACAGGTGTAPVAGSPYAITPSAATSGTFAPGNYTITYVTAPLTVSAAPLAVTANPESKPYGQTLTFASGSTLFSTSGLQNGETIGTVTLAVSGSGGAATATVTGSPYAITPSAATAGTFTPGNYAITYGNGNLTVTPVGLTITAANETKTYGQSVIFAGTEFTTSGLLNSDTVTRVTLTSSGAAASASVAGSPYPIVPSAAVGSGLGNYTITYANGTMAVNAVSLTVTANNQAKSYGQTIASGPGGTQFTPSGLQNGETIGGVTLNSPGFAPTALVAGSPYTITASAANGGTFSPNNYVISYASGALTVNPASLTITANNLTKTFGQTLTFAGTEFTAVGLANGDTVTRVNLSSLGAAASASVTGSPYGIIPSGAVGAGLANYLITYDNGALRVSPAPPIVAWGNPTEINYGTALDTNQLNATASVGGTFIYTPTNGSVLTTGTNTLVAVFTPTDSTDYSETTNTVSLTVLPIPLTITASNISKTYGKTFNFAGTEFTTSGLTNGDTVASVTLTSSGAAPSATVAGSTYSITPSAAIGVGLTNYIITYANGALTVTSAPLTVTADNSSKTYGKTTSFGGTEFTASGLVNGDAVTSVTLNSSGTAATATVAGSPYSIVPSAAVGAGLGNYTITYANGDLTVTPASLTVTAGNQSKTYGGIPSLGTTAFTANGLLNGDVVTSVTLMSPGTAATATVAGSPYPIVPSAAVGTSLGNYTITYANGALTINPASLTVIANNRSKTYGLSVTFAGTEFATTGLLNSDSVTSVTLTSAGAAATATVATSPNSIVPSAAVGVGLGNYTITYANGALTVTPASLTITANIRSKTYGQSVTFAGTEFSTTGLLNSDNVTSVTLTSSGAAATATVAGTPYPIVPSAAVGAGLGNYAITYTDSALTVNAASLTITASSLTKTVGQTLTFDGTEFSTTGLLNSDNVTSVTLTSAGAAASATVAGSPYSIVPSVAVGSGLGNYTIKYVNGTLTVTSTSLGTPLSFTFKFPNLTFSWPTNDVSFELQMTTNLSDPNSWVSVSGTNVSTTNGLGFFRLKQ